MNTMVYRDTFKTVGDIRAATFDLADKLRGTDLADLSAELHDSICRVLPGSPDETAAEIRTKLGFANDACGEA